MLFISRRFVEAASEEAGNGDCRAPKIPNYAKVMVIFNHCNHICFAGPFRPWWMGRGEAEIGKKMKKACSVFFCLVKWLQVELPVAQEAEGGRSLCKSKTANMARQSAVYSLAEYCFC
jgi:hypothetical protein